jgi:hypothetical protein
MTRNREEESSEASKKPIARPKGASLRAIPEDLDEGR